MSQIICWHNESDLMKVCVMSLNSYPLFLSSNGRGGGEGVSRVWATNRVTVFVYLMLKKGLGLRPWATHTGLKFNGPENLFSAPPHDS